MLTRPVLIWLWLGGLVITGLSGCQRVDTPRPSQAAVASAHPTATAAGLDILNNGGNAFDAAVAISATLAVVEPYSSGIGGGGFWLLHRARDAKQIMVDGRETAPFAAHRDMYVNDKGEVINQLSIDGPLAAGIPGQAAALAHIAERYGKLPLVRSLAPAIRAATEGFVVTPHYQRMAKFRIEALRASPDAAAIFLKDNDVPSLDHVIRQPALANTLQRLADRGRDGFYAGAMADKLVNGVRDAGGIWSARDLTMYQAKERDVLTGTYRGYRVTTVAPPSSGGVALLGILNTLSRYDLNGLPPAQRVHLTVEAMRRAYRDRAEYLGDTDFVDVPVSLLTSPDYAAGLAASIHPLKATASETLPGIGIAAQGHHTTHFSVLDRQGNRVAATLSINYPFGSGFVVPGTGVLLNDEMDDFSAKPGTPNVYGLVGAEANAIAPGKRMLSSMSPTFVESDERVAIIGTPGGSRIITMVLHGIISFADGADVDKIVTLPRYHHQYLPDVIQFETDAFDDEIKAELQFMGHQLKETESRFGNMQLVVWDKRTNTVTAASDPRGEGAAVVE